MADKTFLEKCVDGEAQASEIDDYVDAWHESRGGVGMHLREYLGFTPEQHALWVRAPNSINALIKDLQAIKSHARLHDLPPNSLA